ncbi:DUF393 domain-containing protein [Endozoicomonas sp. OPT23]|uniref:thiol-disulfide oxidoreductase DCC family protein n=1 Tax=Endozoicomonas sp. OPT23 TaxID=2072845 RepID=UPI00129AD154|nr:DUF393 domain-containing protein [Endozoicomonas sp. OPT23]MRI33983.1 DUF393 domain-containing protein [Endozoicomonas sp. OPT23]
MKITVYYDGLCPLCTREVAKWRKAAFDCEMEWLDITDNDELLISHGIDPDKALLELHTRTSDGVIRTSIESYSLMLKHLPRWKVFGWVMGLYGVRHFLKWVYDWLTRVRLKKEGRLPIDSCRR